METITASSQGLTAGAIIATVVYSLLGVFIMIIAIVAINAIFRLNVRKELVKENNAAFGILLGGLSIAIAIIIGATILS